MIKGVEVMGKNETYLLLELRVTADKFIVDIAREIFEARCRESGKLLPSLVSLWMEIIAHGKKGD
jgi:hypothetical protein